MTEAQIDRFFVMVQRTSLVWKQLKESVNIKTMEDDAADAMEPEFEPWVEPPMPRTGASSSDAFDLHQIFMDPHLEGNGESNDEAPLLPKRRRTTKKPSEAELPKTKKEKCKKQAKK